MTDRPTSVARQLCQPAGPLGHLHPREAMRAISGIWSSGPKQVTEGFLGRIPPRKKNIPFKHFNQRARPRPGRPHRVSPFLILLAFLLAPQAAVGALISEKTFLLARERKKNFNLFAPFFPLQCGRCGKTESFKIMDLILSVKSFFYYYPQNEESIHRLLVM